MSNIIYLWESFLSFDEGSLNPSKIGYATEMSHDREAEYRFGEFAGKLHRHKEIGKFFNKRIIARKLENASTIELRIKRKYKNKWLREFGDDYFNFSELDKEWIEQYLRGLTSDIVVHKVQDKKALEEEKEIRDNLAKYSELLEIEKDEINREMCELLRDIGSNKGVIEFVNNFPKFRDSLFDVLGKQMAFNVTQVKFNEGVARNTKLVDKISKTALLLMGKLTDEN